MADRTFGLWSEAPEGVTAWGARGIIEKNYAYDSWLGASKAERKRMEKGEGRPYPQQVSLLWDRQSLDGPEEKRKALADKLNAGPLESALREAARLLYDYKMTSDKEGTFVLYEDTAVIIKGDTNGSYGYLYLIGYEKPAAAEADAEAV